MMSFTKRTAAAVAATVLGVLAAVTGPASADGDHGPDTCLRGWVWQEPFPGDHVCATGQTRAAVVAAGPGSVEKRVIDLVATVTSSATRLPKARQAVTDLLAGAGIKPVASPAEVPAAPRSVMYALTAGVDALVADARSRSSSSRQTLGEYAALLETNGRHLTVDRTSRLPAFLAQWLRIARSQPGLPGSNAIFALAAMAARQRPAIDLARPDYDPNELGLTFLDLNLIYAGMARTAAAAFDLKAAESPPESARIESVAALAPGPCDAVAKDLSRLVPPLAGQLEGFVKGAVPTVVKPAVKLITEAYVKYLTDDPTVVAEAVAEVLKHANAISKILQLAETYRLSQASAEVLSANPIHRPLPSQVQNTAVRVTFGIPDDQWHAPGQDTRPSTWSNCLKLMKMPYATSAGDVAAELAQWQAEWKITGPDAIHWKGDGVGTAGLLFTDKLVAESDHSAAVARQFQVMEEADADHPGELVTEDVTITAKLYRPAAPDLGTVITALTTGPAGAIFNYTLKSFSMLFPKRVSVVVHVTRHVKKPAQWSGTVQFTYAKTDVSRNLDEASPPRVWEELTITEENLSGVVRITGVASVEGDTWKSISLQTAITSTASYRKNYSRLHFLPASPDPRGSDCVFVHRDTENTSLAGRMSETAEKIHITIDTVKNTFEMSVPLVEPLMTGRSVHRNTYLYRNPAGNCVNIGTGKSSDDRSGSTEMSNSLGLRHGSPYLASSTITPGQKVFAGRKSIDLYAGRLTMQWSVTGSGL